MKKGRLLLPALLMLACAGCFNVTNTEATDARSIAIDEGTSCRVEFRRDYLGMTGHGVGLGTDVMNGQSVSMGGTVKRMSDSWVVLDGGEGETWIPANAILRIETASPIAE